MVRFGLITLAIVVPVRFFIAEPFIVSGSSMEPTFKNSDYLIVDRLSYKTIKEPSRYDVIIFKYPQNPSKYFIKRIIGLPGEIIELKGKEIIIKNTAITDGFNIDQSYIKNFSSDNATYTLDKDQYFVMGDNRTASSDSRVWGPLKRDLIVGRALFRLFPLQAISIFPGDHSN